MALLAASVALAFGNALLPLEPRGAAPVLANLRINRIASDGPDRGSDRPGIGAARRAAARARGQQPLPLATSAEPTAVPWPPLYAPVLLASSALAPLIISPANAADLTRLGHYPQPGFVESLGFSQSSQLLHWEGQHGLGVLELATGRVVLTLDAHDKQTHHAIYVHQDRLLLTGGVDSGGGRIRAWEPSTGREQWSKVVTPAGWGPLFGVSPDGRWLVSGAARVLTLWRLTETGLSEVKSLGGGGGLPDISLDGVVAFWEEGVLLKYVEADGWLHLPAPSEGCGASDVVFSPSGRQVAAGAQDGTARIWQVADGKLVQSLPGHDGSVWTVDFSADGRLLATGAEDGEVRVFDTQTGQLLRRFALGDRAVTAVAFSPDGRMLAAVSGKIVALWGLP